MALHIALYLLIKIAALWIKFLVKKLQGVYRPDERKLEDLLKAENNLGETPIYRAVAHGQTQMAKSLAAKVRDLSSHFRRRKDEMSILHIAVIGQHFGLSDLSYCLTFKLLNI